MHGVHLASSAAQTLGRLLQRDTTALLLRFVPGIALTVGAWRVAVIPQRRCELRADQHSVGYVGRDAVLQTLRHLAAETPAAFRWVAALGLETHPSPGQRIRRIAQL